MRHALDLARTRQRMEDHSAAQARAERGAGSESAQGPQRAGRAEGRADAARERVPRSAPGGRPGAGLDAVTAVIRGGG